MTRSRRFIVGNPSPPIEYRTGSGEDWRLAAACKDTDPEAFFPAGGENPRTAKKVCAGCDVQPACLAYALDHHIRDGLWGGLTERDRRKLLRERGAA
jgi:WhiB family redox-sensing transcriptional regulator